MEVWSMVRGLAAMWELKASKVSSSVIVAVWLAQIGRAGVSAWLPWSSPRHGTEQPCTSAPAHQTPSGTYTVTGSYRFHMVAREPDCYYLVREQLFHYKLKSNSIKQIFTSLQMSGWPASATYKWAKDLLWIKWQFKNCKIKNKLWSWVIHSVLA